MVSREFMLRRTRYRNPVDDPLESLGRFGTVRIVGRNMRIDTRWATADAEVGAFDMRGAIGST